MSKSKAIQEAIRLLEEYTKKDKWHSGDKVVKAINILKEENKGYE